MFRVERLHVDASPVLATAGPPGHLGDQLEGPLRGAKVGQVQGGVRIDDAHDGHVRKVQSLGNHLGAEQDLNLTGSKSVQGPFVAAAAAHCIGIHP